MTRKLICALNLIAGLVSVIECVFHFSIYNLVIGVVNLACAAWLADVIIDNLYPPTTKTFDPKRACRATCKQCGITQPVDENSVWFPSDAAAWATSHQLRTGHTVIVEPINFSLNRAGSANR